MKLNGKGDGIDNWACLASTIDDQIPSARNEIIISSQAKGSILIHMQFALEI